MWSVYNKQGALITAVEVNSEPVSIEDQDGNVIAEVQPGGVYNVIVVSNIDGGGSATIYQNSIINP